jgi:hypothetical protein
MYRSKRRKRMNRLLSNKKSMAISMTIMLALVIVLSTSGSAMGQEDKVTAGRNEPTAPSQQQGPTDPAELEAFLDEELGREMEKHHIAGATVSVVKDGGLFFGKVTAPPISRTTSLSTPSRRSFP